MTPTVLFHLNQNLIGGLMQSFVWLSGFQKVKHLIERSSRNRILAFLFFIHDAPRQQQIFPLILTKRSCRSLHIKWSTIFPITLDAYRIGRIWHHQQALITWCVFRTLSDLFLPTCKKRPFPYCTIAYKKYALYFIWRLKYRFNLDKVLNFFMIKEPQ